MNGEARIVSVIVPCRNERGHVEAFASSALSQRLPEGWQLEIVIADGESDDGTAEALAALGTSDARVVVVANPGRIVSTGLNAALAKARGEVIVRMDVHTTYASDYVAECIAALERTGADNVGGPWRAESAAGGGAMQAAIVAAFQSAAAAGGALSRRIDHEGEADTVYLGAWPRRTFARWGGFDEALVRNQDDEHNLRITKGGGRIWQSARIRSAYRPRARLGQVFRQYLQYGYWKPFVMKKHGQAASMRHGVPALFVVALALGIVATLAGFGWPLVLLLLAYAAVVMSLAAAVARASRLPMAALLRVPVVIAACHVAYGIGSVAGAWDAYVARRARAAFTHLSR